MDIPCPQCGSTNYEEEDGLQVCENGHYLEGAQQVVDTEQEFGAPRGKVTTKKIERTKIKVAKVFRGIRAFKLYLQAWQHILWKQCYAMIHSYGVPPELWTVARDLWTLRLSLLTARLGLDSIRSNPDVNLPIDHDTTPNPSDAETSAPDSDHPTASGSTLTQTPTLIDTLATISLSLTLLHYPLPLYTLHKLTIDLQLPYIRALRHLPSVMTQKLPPEYHLALDTISIPRLENLPHAVHRLVQAYSDTFLMQFPAINWPLMLQLYIEKLALPIEVYAAVKKLRELVGAEFRWEVEISQPEEDKDLDKAARRTRRRRSPVARPEAQLMSLLVVAVKMLFPFRADVALVEELGAHRLRMDWRRWLDIRKSYNDAMEERDASKAKNFLETTDRDVQDMSGEELDGYMDWFQELYTESDESVIRMAKGREVVVGELLKTFPVEKVSAKRDEIEAKKESDQNTERRRVVEVQQSLYVEEDTKRGDTIENVGDEAERATPLRAIQNAGERARYYPIFSSPEDLASKDDEVARVFHEQAAQEACLTFRQLLGAVVYTERRLLNWADTKRREEVFGGQFEHSDLDDELESRSAYDHVLQELDIGAVVDRTEIGTS